MKLNMKIQNIKSIKNFEISLPVSKGLYAITGQNGSGKSTIVTCASSAFFNMRLNEYFGKTGDDAKIYFELNRSTKEWKKNRGRWNKYYNGRFQLTGFYEGSIIYGNRFRNTKYDILMRLDRIGDRQLEEADDFIRVNLGKILHNNENFYEKIYYLNRNDAGNIGLNGDIFYYQKSGRRVSQFHMSTGENLLISILDSLNRRNRDRTDLQVPCVLLLDEIELALHPSSLKRLIVFLKEISSNYNYAVYFSTHSIELISSISPDNIFFIERHADDSLDIINPCYPAYATRILYDHDGYDYIILVEDDLARQIVRKILKDNSLICNKLIHVLPCGGYTNTIDLAHEVISSNLVGKISKICIILDRDVKESSQEYIRKNKIANNIPLNYLPISSLEKYLKLNLVDIVDHKFFRDLNDFIFHYKSITQIIEDYRSNHNPSNDRNGKIFYNYIDDELRKRNVTRGELIDFVIKYLSDGNIKELDSLVVFLKSALQ